MSKKLFVFLIMVSMVLLAQDADDQTEKTGRNLIIG